MDEKIKAKLVVIGGSTGGFKAMQTILGALPADFPLPVAVVLHREAQSTDMLVDLMQRRCPLSVKEADEKEYLVPGVVYFAPANYHLLIERGRKFSLSIDPRVQYSRPSIDVLFETAVAAYAAALVGILLTGANQDGVDGICRIAAAGGTAVVQDPETAVAPTMPRAAIDRECAGIVLSVTDIASLLATKVINL